MELACSNIIGSSHHEPPDREPNDLSALLALMASPHS
jgi:hypothetical protein